PARCSGREPRLARARAAAAAAAAARPPADAKPASDGHPASRRRGGRFVSESWAELQKVDWPGQQQLIQGTVVVLIACLVTGVYLFAADELFRRLVQHVLLR